MNRARVQELRNLIDGLPEERITLDEMLRQGSPYSPDRLIGCMAAWAWVHPPFVEQGIRSAVSLLVWTSREAHTFFGLDPLHDLFGPKYPSERGTDKEVALARLDKLLKGKS